MTSNPVMLEPKSNKNAVSLSQEKMGFEEKYWALLLMPVSVWLIARAYGALKINSSTCVWYMTAALLCMYAELRLIGL